MKWSAIVAWLVILSICIGLPVLRARQSREATQYGTASDVDISTRLMGRYIVGAARVFPKQGPGMISTLDDQPHADETPRIATAIVAGELIGRDGATSRLKRIDTPAARDFLSVYQSGDTTADLSAEQARFGWFADLARSFGRSDTDPLRKQTIGEATKTFAVAMIGLGVGGLGALAGLVLFVTAIVLISAGNIQFAYLRPTGRAYTYIEAFAIYLVGIFAVGEALGLAWPGAPLWVHILGMFCPIVIAFYWPMLRGGLWKHQRRDWGVHTGKGIFIEALCGIGGYLAGLPIMAAGILITFLLVAKSGATATHPIMQDLDMNPLILLGIASVFAPLTEELLFRGALVSHLRGMTGVVLSAIVSGLIFASVHPQGWAAIPALASIGCVLALIRQWRGSLVPSMVAHALHNGILLTVVILMLH